MTYSKADFSRFQGMVGDQEGIASAHSDETVNQFGLLGEVTSGPWWYGTALRFGQHEWTQTFLPGEGHPDRGYGTVDGYFLDFAGGRRWTINTRLSAGVWTGPTFTWNIGSSTWQYGDDDVEDDRSLTGLKWSLGGYAEWEPIGGWPVRFSLSHHSLRSDADDHNLYQLGVLRTFRPMTEFHHRPGKVSGVPYEKAITARLDSMRRSVRREQP